MEKPWYETLFENFAKKYDTQSFTTGTLGECDFIEREISFDRSCRILDVGCGTGRHSLELAKRGYSVLGVDLSEKQLEHARNKAVSEGVVVEFQRHDARMLPFKGEFDVAIMLCEGGFPLMETDEMNFQILKSVTAALKEHGKFILTTLNALYALRLFFERSDGQVEQSIPADGDRSFDPITFREHSVLEFEDDQGIAKRVRCSERYYSPSELNWLLKSLGFMKIDVFGAQLGAFSREEVLTAQHFEMLVVAEK